MTAIQKKIQNWNDRIWCGSWTTYENYKELAYLKSERIEELEIAIKNLRNQKKDDLCRLDLDKLYEVLGDNIKRDYTVDDKAEMLKNCERYINHVCSGGGGRKSYQQLEHENEILKIDNKLMKKELGRDNC